MILTEDENITNLTAYLDILLSDSSKETFVIIDGDRTLIPSDSTKYFFQYLQLEYNDIKSIFKKFGYSFNAFYNAALYYSKIEKDSYEEACIETAKQVSIYPDFLSFISEVKSKVEFILITSGIKKSWENVIHNHSLDFMHLIGGNYLHTDNFLVDRNIKGIIAKLIKSLNKKVFAFGDAIIDFDMLKEANQSYLVVNEKHNVDIIPVANQISHLEQISFSGYFHPHIPLTNFRNIIEQILTT